MRIDQSILTGAYASSFLLYADVHIPVMNIFLSVACLSYHSALCIFTVTSFSLSLTSPYILPTFVLRRVHECGKNCRRCGRQGSSRQAQHDLLGMCVLHCLGPSLPFSRVLLYKCPGILSCVFFFHNPPNLYIYKLPPHLRSLLCVSVASCVSRDAQGTNVSSGKARGIVVSTGVSTEIGPFYCSSYIHT